LRFRLLAAFLLLLLLGGPSPGAVGSCEERRRLAELRPYCEEREQLVCWRRYLRGELGGGEREVNECRATAISRCQNRYWPPDCRPSERQTDACLNALRSYDTLDIPESEIAECSVETLCQATGELQADVSDGGRSP
jgi:hypothetical protein